MTKPEKKVKRRKTIKKARVKKASAKTQVNKMEEFKKFITTKANIVNENMNYGKISFKVIWLMDKGRQVGDNGKGNVIFSMNSSKNYRSASLQVYISAFDAYCDGEYDNNELIDGLVHEFAHVHTIPISDLAMARFVNMAEIIDASEELTETMAIYVRENLRNKNKEIKLYN